MTAKKKTAAKAATEGTMLFSLNPNHTLTVMGKLISVDDSADEKKMKAIYDKLPPGTYIAVPAMVVASGKPVAKNVVGLAEQELDPPLDLDEENDNEED